MSKRFAVNVMLFNCDNFILPMLENCGPFVEKIYVTYSKVPWLHNPKARDQFENKTSLDILKKSKYFDKIEVIQGVWNSDAEQRMSCFKVAQTAGYDYLLIQDADEYYKFTDYKKNVEEVERNPDFDVYEIPWLVFWKTLDYILVNEKNETVWYTPFAVNIKKGITSMRTANNENDKIYRLSGLCYHLSYVLTNEEVYSKIKTWGHSAQFDNEKWYKEKWLKWNLNSRNLHPVYPRACKKAIKFEGQLPEVLHDFRAPELVVYKYTVVDLIIKNISYFFDYFNKDYFYSILKKIGFKKIYDYFKK